MAQKNIEDARKPVVEEDTTTRKKTLEEEEEEEDILGRKKDDPTKSATARKRREERVRDMMVSPEEYLQRMKAAMASGMGLRESDTYSRRTAEALRRIRESQSTEREEEKSVRERAAEAAIARGGAFLSDRTAGRRDFSLDSRYMSPLRAASTVIGADRLRSTRLRASGTPQYAAVRDLSTDDGVAAESKFGTSEDLTRYADPNLVKTYKASEAKRALMRNSDVNVDKGSVSLTDLNRTYRQLSRVSTASRSLGRRDTYVPNSTNFLDNTYKGSIYSRSYSVDPSYRNSARNLTQTKSTGGYYNLNTREAYSDWYQREYGVGRSYVPTSASRQYEVNTMKQWEDDLRRDRGINVRSGTMTYAEMYHLRTGR